MNRLAVSKILDRISNHLEGLGREIPREASNLRKIVLRLDRVANTLEADERVFERVSRIEKELDNLDVDFTVAPNSSGRKATHLYVYKGQMGQQNEASVLGQVAKRYGATLENENRVYKIVVPHHSEHDE